MTSPHLLSLVAHFDYTTRNRKILTEGIETDIHNYLSGHHAQLRLTRDTGVQLTDARQELHIMLNENAVLSTKLKHARHQIEIEIEKSKDSNRKRELLERQVTLIRELLTDKHNTTMFTERDKEKLAFLSCADQTALFAGPPRTPAGHMTPVQLSSDTPTVGSIRSVRRERSTSMSDDASMYDKTGDDFIYNHDKSIYDNHEEEEYEEEAVNVLITREPEDVTYLRNGRVYKRSSNPNADITPPDKRHRRSKSRKSDKRSKGHRRSRSANLVTTTTLVVDDININDIQTTHTETTDQVKCPATGKRRLKKSYSTTHAIDLAAPMSTFDEESLSDYRTPTSHYDNLHCNLRHYTSAGKSLNRLHTFIQKTVIKPDTCIPCGKRIKFGKVVMRCRDCKSSCHPDCRDLVPLPCCPPHSTPGHGKQCPGKIEDYTSNVSPMIPALIIHCVTEIEKRGLYEVGIYRVNGSDKQIRDLKVKFLSGKGTPILHNVDDIHTVCGCVKDFLRNLKEPIVTFALWQNFVEAAMDERDHECLLMQNIGLLPQANRDTLAYIVLHLQRVALSKKTQMNAENLSRVFGPTLIGYSNSNPEPLQMLNETPKQVIVVEKLLDIPSDYWDQFIMCANNSVDSEIYITQPPVTTRASRKSTFEKGFLTNTPRFSKTLKMPSRFFSSPGLK